MCDAFCEVVRAGVKRIALSHPFTQDELDTVLGADFIRDCTAIAAQYGCGAHHQTEPLLTDLFPISLNAGRQNVIFYRDPADLEAFLGICLDKRALVASAPTRATRGAKSPCVWPPALLQRRSHRPPDRAEHRTRARQLDRHIRS